VRITDKMMFERGNAATGSARERVADYQNQISTGLRIQHPGDDPAAASAIVGGALTQARYDAIVKTASRAQGDAVTADGALQGMTELVSRAKELGVQMSNDTYSATDRAAAGQEVDGLVHQMVALLNTSVSGRYLFGGTKDNAPPFDAVGNYSGDANVKQLEVAPGVLENASLRMDVLVKGVGGGVDILGTLQSLSTAMKSGSGAAIEGVLGAIDTSTSQLTTAIAQNGVMISSFGSAQSLGQLASQQAQKSVSDAGDTDMFTAASSLAEASQALQASLAATAQGFKLSLLNYMPMS
jgi:flagellar hook-associated protein 3 FlgL